MPTAPSLNTVSAAFQFSHESEYSNLSSEESKITSWLVFNDVFISAQFLLKGESGANISMLTLSLGEVMCHRLGLPLKGALLSVRQACDAEG